MRAAAVEDDAILFALKLLPFCQFVLRTTSANAKFQTLKLTRAEGNQLPALNLASYVSGAAGVMHQGISTSKRPVSWV